MVAYMLYVTTLIATIRRIVEFAEQFQRGMTGIERFAEIMDTPVTIGDAPDAVPLQPGPGDIRFENVSFEYPDDHNKVLHNSVWISGRANGWRWSAPRAAARPPCATSSPASTR